MNKVLIITYYWPPAGGGGVQRWVKFVKYLREFGWEPIVYTVEGGDYPIIDEALQTELPENLSVIRQPIIEPYTWYKRLTGKSKTEKIDANFLSQGKKLNWKDKVAVWIRGNFFIPDARFLWIRPSVKYLNEYLVNHRVDAMISTGPPHSCHLIALGIKKRHHIPWLVDYRDPWTQIDYFEDLGLTRVARQLHIRLEKKVLNHCDLIATVGKTMAEDLKTLTSNKTVVITNGYDESDRPTNAEVNRDKLNITYIGTMNDARNPLVFWAALCDLKTEYPPIMDVLQVNLVGKPEEVVAAAVRRFELTHVVNFTGYVTHKEAIRYQNEAYILLLVINHTSNNKSILTGKIFEYLASGRPVLCIGPKDGDAADILHDAGNGLVVDYEAKDEIKNYLKAAYLDFIQDKYDSNKGDVSKYSRRNLTKKLAESLNEMITKP